ncbi:MAG TPA: nucleotidyltransferase family protein [Acidobacteriota bacterium]|nr:nucleotidyltransferase family protein [Acidobacteriota bacterium]
MSLPNIVPVVLAAGASSRMGSPKPLLPLGESTYLGTILDTLAGAPVASPIVVLGHAAAEVLEAVDLREARAVVNENWGQGMLSSLQFGLRSLSDHGRVDAMLLVLVDVPRFRGATIERLVAEFARAPSVLVVPTHAGEHGHPVLFARALFEELLRAPAETGARAVVDAHRADLLEVDVDDPWVIRDADTPEDHQRLIAVD